MQTINKDVYYGSDLNKFVDEKCSHQMTCINIDGLFIKVAKKKLRIIESKHNNERMPTSQESALKTLNYIFKNSSAKYETEVCKVEGDYPYIDGACVYRFGDGIKKYLNQKQLIEWLEFEKELESFP